MTTINPVPQKYILSPEQEEFEPGGCTAQEEENEIALYSHMLEGQIHQLSLTALFRAHYGDTFISTGMLASQQLLQMKPLTVLKKENTQCLKQSIEDSTLSKTASFAARKTQFARCVQMTDPLAPVGAIQCLEHHSKGLSPAQQKELKAFLPHAMAGKAVNELMAPFAALSQAIKYTMKALYLGAVSNACLETDPQNFNQCVSQLRYSLEGNDPALNKSIKEAMPQWVLKAGELMAQGDAKLQAFDDYMYDQYRTLPGIVHEGVYGMVDAGLPTVTGAAIKLTGRVAGAGVNAIKTVAHAARDAREINQIVAALYREATRGSIETFTVKPGMEFAAKNLTAYSSEIAFANSLAQKGSKPIELRNVGEVLPSIAKGRSGSSVYFVESGDKSLPIVLKDYPGLIAPHSRFGQELVAYDILQSLQLTHMELPKLLKVGKMLPEGETYYRGLLAMSRVPGKSLAESLEKQSTLHGLQRAAQLEENYRAANAIGKAIGELHGRSATQVLEPSQKVMQLHADRIRNFFNTAENLLSKQGFSFKFHTQDVEKIIADFFKNPGKTGFTHGDAHYQNFIWDAQRTKLAAIDTGSMAQMLDKFGKPVGIQVQDIAAIKVTGEFFAHRSGLTNHEVLELNRRFLSGYAQLTALTMHSEEALRFYECYWRLFVLNFNNQNHEAWLKTIQSLNALCKP